MADALGRRRRRPGLTAKVGLSFLLMAGGPVGSEQDRASEPRPARPYTRLPLHKSILSLRNATNPTGSARFLLFFVHVERTGGTTWRKHMMRIASEESVRVFTQGTIVFRRRNPALPITPHDRCTEARGWFREDRSCLWSQFVDEVLRYPERHTRTFVEIGAMTMGVNKLGTILDDVDRMRAALDRRWAVLAWTQVRSPMSHVKSLWNYFIRNRAREPFETFMHHRFAHNFQTRLLLGHPILVLSRIDPDEVEESLSPAVSDVVKTRLRVLRATPEDIAPRVPQLLGQLQRMVVAPVEDLHGLFLTVFDAMEIENIHPMMANAFEDRYTMMQRRKRPLRKQAPRVDNISESMKAHLSQTFALDYRVYRQVAGAWRGRMASLGPSQRARFDRYRRLMRVSDRLEAHQV